MHVMSGKSEIVFNMIDYRDRQVWNIFSIFLIEGNTVKKISLHINEKVYESINESCLSKASTIKGKIIKS